MLYIQKIHINDYVHVYIYIYTYTYSITMFTFQKTLTNPRLGRRPWDSAARIQEGQGISRKDGKGSMSEANICPYKYGWWLSHPSEKYYSIGMIIFDSPQYMEKIKVMFQTTNRKWDD